MKQLIPLFLIILFSLNLNAQSATDEKAIHQVIQTMVEGWNTADGEKFASVFAVEHDFIVWNGYYFKDMNKQQNAGNHNGIFRSIYKDTKNYSTIDKIRFVRDDIAMVHVLGAISRKGEGRPKDPQVIISMLMEKKNDSWKVVSFHNLDVEVFQNEEIKNNSPIPPEVMYANWYAAAKK